MQVRLIELTPNPLFDTEPRRLQLQSPDRCGSSAPFTFPRTSRQCALLVRLNHLTGQGGKKQSQLLDMRCIKPSALSIPSLRHQQHVFCATLSTFKAGAVTGRQAYKHTPDQQFIVIVQGVVACRALQRGRTLPSFLRISCSGLTAQQVQRQKRQQRPIGAAAAPLICGRPRPG